MNKRYPNFDEEQKCWRRGYKIVVGVDEAGRGPLAGPVVAGAVCFKFSSPPQSRRGLRGGDDRNSFHHPTSTLPSSEGRGNFGVLRDSKKLSARQREEWYKILTTCADIKWGTGIVSEKIIDKINIFGATKVAMKKAIECLEKKCYIFSDRQMRNTKKDSRIDFIILDGNFTLDDLSINQKAIVRADEKVFSCAAASIIAKVTRDRLMLKYAKRYPEYGFEKHKGYGTKQHISAIKKCGPCAIHRRSFEPLKSLL